MEKKSCYNCEHYEAFYIKGNTKFIKTFFKGCCKCSSISVSKNKNFPFPYGCEKWILADEEAKRKKRLSSIKSAIISSVKKLEELAELLKNIDQ